MRARLASLLAIITMATTAQAADDPETVTIRDFTLAPMGHLAYRANRLVIHPKAMIGAGYNSNVEATTTAPVADTYGEVVAGFESRYRIGDSQEVTVDLEGEGRGHEEVTDRDLVGGRARARYALRDHVGMGYQAQGSYSRSDDPLIESGQQITRGVGNLGASAEWRGLRTRVSLAGEWQNENFFEGGSGFSEDERDSDTRRLDLAAGQSPSEGAELFVRLISDAKIHAEDGRFQDSQGLAGLVGWRGLIATRISILAEAGVERRVYDGAFPDDPSQVVQVTAPIGTAAWWWAWEAGSHIAGRAYRSIISPVSTNAATLTGMEGDLRYRLREQAALIAGGKVYLIEHRGAPTGRPSEKRGTGRVWTGAECFLRSGVGLRLVGAYEASDSRTANDYERISVLLSLGFAY